MAGGAALCVLLLLAAGTGAQAAPTASAPASVAAAAAVGAAAAPGRAAAAIAAAPVFAAPAQTALPGPSGGLARVALALVLVVGAIFAAGWFSRRMHGARGTRHPGLEVLAQLSLGPRERAVLIRVGAQQLLVGVAGGHIRTLHVCEPGTVPAMAAGSAGADVPAAHAQAAAGGDVAQRPSFKALLLKSLGK